MKDKSLPELRQLARTRGIKGYSKLTKSALIALLTEKPSPKQAPTKAETAQADLRKVAGTAERRAQPRPAPTAPGNAELGDAGREQLVEDVKFALTPPGGTALPRQPMVDLGEDIENLPTPADPFICLLPQKPGILHGYWRLLPGTIKREAKLLLRLCFFAGDRLGIIEELPVPSDSGHWYFHMRDTGADRNVFLQIGTYQNGEFVTSIRRGIARIPSLYASVRQDRQWWVSPEQFSAMYQRAGGISTSETLGWKPDNSFSSR